MTEQFDRSNDTEVVFNFRDDHISREVESSSHSDADLNRSRSTYENEVDLNNSTRSSFHTSIEVSKEDGDVEARDASLSSNVGDVVTSEYIEMRLREHSEEFHQQQTEVIDSLRQMRELLTLYTDQVQHPIDRRETECAKEHRNKSGCAGERVVNGTSYNESRGYRPNASNIRPELAEVSSAAHHRNQDYRADDNQQTVICHGNQLRGGDYRNIPGQRIYENEFVHDGQGDIRFERREKSHFAGRNNAAEGIQNRNNANRYFAPHPVSQGYFDMQHPHFEKQTTNISIPPFDGKDEWRVWLGRFEAVARRLRWSDDDKLNHMLPRLQGSAAEFVFGQLPYSVVDDYQSLVGELNSRYRVVHTSRSYAAKFSKRDQHYGETVEAYAAELKMLYDKAHGYREGRIRQEDLVRRFLDGILDDEARFAVEYQKEPEDIDEAVFHVVNFLQTRAGPKHGEIDDKRNRKYTRRTLGDSESCPKEDIQSVNQIRGYQSAYKREITDKKENGDINMEGTQQVREDRVSLEHIIERITKLEEKQDGRYGYRPSRQRVLTCFNCRKPGHIARECLEPKRDYQARGKYDEARSNEQSKTDETGSGNLNANGPALVARGWSS